MTTSELHTHVFLDGIDYSKSVARHRGGVDQEAVGAVLAEYKSHGITFVRDGGDPYGACLYAKSIAGEYGIDYIMPAFALYRTGNYGRVAGLAYSDLGEYLEMIKKAASLGADFIKIMVSGILDFDKFGVVSETDYTPDFIRELVNIAHGEGFAVMAHASGTRAVRMAAEAGADSIEHGYYMDSETMDIIREKGIVYVPTAVTCVNLAGTGRFDEDQVRRIIDHTSDVIQKAYEKGVLIGCGSDAGAFAVPHGAGTVNEYDFLTGLLGAGAENVFKKAATVIKEKFRRNA